MEAGCESVISRRARGSVGWLPGVMLRGESWEAKSEGGWRLCSAVGGWSFWEVWWTRWGIGWGGVEHPSHSSISESASLESSSLDL